MNFLTNLLHLAGSGVFAYYSAAQIRDSKTRPPTSLRGFSWRNLALCHFYPHLAIAQLLKAIHG
ncbi:hypothetical protein NSTCB13_06390 [Nostoc sp. DSM 114160]|jgi:hypothetical protein